MNTNISDMHRYAPQLQSRRTVWDQHQSSLKHEHLWRSLLSSEEEKQKFFSVNRLIPFYGLFSYFFNQMKGQIETPKSLRSFHLIMKSYIDSWGSRACRYSSRHYLWENEDWVLDNSVDVDFKYFWIVQNQFDYQQKTRKSSWSYI